MKRISRRGSADDGAGLLRRLSGNPAFPAFIRQLPARAIVRLIDEVGLEDSHEILAAMESHQFRETMSLSLWTNAGVGRDETLDIDQLIRWIELWLQEGDATACRRITELGEDFIVACFRQLLMAIDCTASGAACDGIEIGHFAVFPKRHKHWPRVVEVLIALWGQEPDFVLRVLRRCSHERSILSEAHDEEDAADSLLQDLTAERNAQRVQVGHVSPLDASIFLSSAKTAPLEQLCAQQEYDLNTADYLVRADRLVMSASLAPTISPDTEEADVVALDAILREAGVLEPRADAALTTDTPVTSVATCLEQAIAALAIDAPQIASKRTRELAYLANVVMSGAQSQNRRYTETEAARMVIATANLGATYLLRDPAGQIGATDRLSGLLEHEPGVVRLFQLGFKLLSAIPSRCCEAVYLAKDAQSKRRGHVIYLEMEEILGASVLTDLVREGRYPEAKSVIDELSAVMDNAACVALRILIDPVPAYPLVLEEQAGEAGIYIDRAHRPVETIADLERIGAFLGHLVDY